jgi:hypothetical protein
MDSIIRNKREKVYAVAGALVGGGILLIASIFQPIDGIPGYQLIIKEDFSIIFGFAFATFIGGLVGVYPGILVGRWLEERGTDKKHRNRPEILEQAFIEFQDRYLETLFLKKEESISSGREVSDQEVADEAIEQVVPQLAQKYDLSRDEMDEIVARFVAVPRSRERRRAE